jgi:hypothetical protein
MQRLTVLLSLALAASILGSSSASAQWVSANPDSPDLDFAAPFLEHLGQAHAGVYSHDVIHTPDGRVVVAFVERHDAGGSTGDKPLLPRDELVVVMRATPTAPWIELMRGHYNHDQIVDLCLAVPDQHYNDPKRDLVFVAATLEFYFQNPDGSLDTSKRQRAVAVLRGSYKAPNPKSKWFQIAIPEQKLAYVPAQNVAPRPRLTTVAADASGSTYFVDLVYVDAAGAGAAGGHVMFARSKNLGAFFPKPARLTGPLGGDRVTWLGEPADSKLAGELHRHPTIDGSWLNRYTAIAFQNATHDAIEVVRVTTNAAGAPVYEYEHRIAENGAPLREPALAVADEGATLLARGLLAAPDGAMQLLWYRGGVTKGPWTRNFIGVNSNLLQQAYSAPDVDVRGNWMRVACEGREDAGGPIRVLAFEGRWRAGSGYPVIGYAVDDASFKDGSGAPRTDLSPLAAFPYLGAVYSFTRKEFNAKPGSHRFVALDD